MSGKFFKQKHKQSRTEQLLEYCDFSTKESIHEKIAFLSHRSLVRDEQNNIIPTDIYIQPQIAIESHGLKPDSRLLKEPEYFNLTIDNNCFGNQISHENAVKLAKSKMMLMIEHLCDICNWDNEHYYSIILATTANLYIDWFWTPQEVSRILCLLKDANIIHCNKFTYNGLPYYYFIEGTKNGKAIQYCFNIAAAKKFLKKCKLEGIKAYKPVIRNSTWFDTNIAKKDYNINPTQVKVGKVKLIKPKNVSWIDYEHQVIKILLEQDTITTKRIKEVEQLTFEDKNLAERYMYNVTWDKCHRRIINISIRSTNTFCSVKKEGNKDELTRQKIRAKFNFNNEYDVKSSVPKITYLLNHGYWLNDNIDLYEEMWKEFCKLSNEPFIWNKEIRRKVKYIFMFAYFDSYFEKNIKRNISIMANYVKEVTDGEITTNIKSCQNEYIETLTLFKKAVINTIGNPLGPEVFKHESNIYLDVQCTIKNCLNEECWRVYDAFYYNISDLEIDKLIEYKALSYYKEIQAYNSYGNILKTAISLEDLQNNNYELRNYYNPNNLYTLMNTDNNVESISKKSSSINITLVKKHEDIKKTIMTALVT